MCGRYFIDAGDREWMRVLELLTQEDRQSPAFADMRTGEVYPTHIVPVLTAPDRAHLMQWGFTRFDGKGQVINARSETAGEKSMFRRPLSQGRCLIPASCYYEWRKLEGGGKQKYALSPREPLYMAGLYRREQGAALPRFVIMTRDAAPEIAFIHDRMPVIFDKPAQQKWLERDVALDALLAQAENAIRFEPADGQTALF